MTSVIVGILVLAALAAVFAWLTRRAWGAGSGAGKWIGLLLAGALTLIFAALSVFAAVGAYKLFHKYTVSVPEVASSPGQTARGIQVAAELCASCHSLNGDLPLSGGENLSEDAGMPLGDIYAPNLTPASDLKDWPDADLFRLLRTGVDDEGRATAMTAVAGPRALSDEDTLAVIAYLRQQPAVENETPSYNPSVLMALLAGAGMIPIDVPAAVTPVAGPPPAATAAYGQYVAGYMDCKSCHGEKLDGQVAPPYPAGPDIRRALAVWSKDQFENEVANHAAAAGPKDVMPWKFMARMNSVEMEALYLYLHQEAGK